MTSPYVSADDITAPATGDGAPGRRGIREGEGELTLDIVALKAGPERVPFFVQIVVVGMVLMDEGVGRIIKRDGDRGGEIRPQGNSSSSGKNEVQRHVDSYDAFGGGF